MTDSNAKPWEASTDKPPPQREKKRNGMARITGSKRFFLLDESGTPRDLKGKAATEAEFTLDEAQAAAAERQGFTVSIKLGGGLAVIEMKTDRARSRVLELANSYAEQMDDGVRIFVECGDESRECLKRSGIVPFTGQPIENYDTLRRVAQEVVDEIETVLAMNDDVDRRDGLIRGPNGKPLPILANVLTLLRSKLASVLAFDEMLQAPVLTGPLPGKNEWKLRPVTDNDVGVIQEYLQREGMPTLGKDVTHQAVALRAKECAFHPVRDWLSGLTWDGTPRVGCWTTTYLGAAETKYTKAIGQMFLISMVARIFDPGCKVDHMVIFEGDQGTWKSGACKVLAGAWFSDSLPDLAHHAKDVSQHLRGKWLIEVAEMSAMSKAESAALKAFLTRTEEKYRPSFGRQEVFEPRQCVFAGTTNETVHYLKDKTGNRRFWPVKTGLINLDTLAKDRDQLFAEAVRLYRAGQHWWPDRNFERKIIFKEQEKRLEDEPWEEIILDWLVKQREGDPKNAWAWKINEIATQALNISKERMTKFDQNRIVGCLKRLGWKRSETASKGYHPWQPTTEAVDGKIVKANAEKAKQDAAAAEKAKQDAEVEKAAAEKARIEAQLAANKAWREKRGLEQ